MLLKMLRRTRASVNVMECEDESEVLKLTIC